MKAVEIGESEGTVGFRITTRARSLPFQHPSCVPSEGLCGSCSCCWDTAPPHRLLLLSIQVSTQVSPQPSLTESVPTISSMPHCFGPLQSTSHLCWALGCLSLLPLRLQSRLSVSLRLHLHHFEEYLANKRVKVRPAPHHWGQVISSEKGTFPLGEGRLAPPGARNKAPASRQASSAELSFSQRQGERSSFVCLGHKLSGLSWVLMAL